MVLLVAGGNWRYPKARPERLDGAWSIGLNGPGEEVIPLGIEEAGERRAAVLETTVHDAYLSLDRVTRIEDDEEAADALAGHARVHPVARLLCHHGLPMWHGGPDPCRMLMSPAGTACLSLGQVRTVMDGLRGLEDLACHVSTRSRPAAPAQVTAALQWPILPSYLTKPARAETERDGELFLDRCRQIVASSLRVLQDASLLRRDVEWVSASQLQLVVHAHTDLALYVHAFTERLLPSGSAHCDSDQQAQQRGDSHRHHEDHQHAGAEQQGDHRRSEAG